MTEQSQSREGAPRPAEDTPGLSTTAGAPSDQEVIVQR